MFYFSNYFSFVTHTVTCYDNVTLNLNDKFHTTLIKDTANNNTFYFVFILMKNLFILWNPSAFLLVSSYLQYNFWESDIYFMVLSKDYATLQNDRVLCRKCC